MNLKVVLVSFLVFCFSNGLKAQGLPYKGGHSHNDYLRQRPLMDAVENGLISIEADVFPVGEELWVAHTREDLQKEKTLESLYFAPLRKLVNDNKIKNLILLIDIKTEPEQSYRLLKILFAKYAEMLTQYDTDTIQVNTVSIILSGERPMSLLNEKKRYAALDGRFDEISFKYNYSYFPLISDDWNKYFTWNGTSVISNKENIEMKKLVSKCHNQHKIIRFWGFPADTSNIRKFWQLFESAGVDLIGTDDPSGFNNFYNSLK